MKLRQPGRCRAALTGTVMALGVMTGLAAAGTAAGAATHNSGRAAAAHSSSRVTVANSTHYLMPRPDTRQKLVYSARPLGWHTPDITSQLCSSSTAHWFTLHINYLGGPSGWAYYCFGYKGTWYFPSNTFAWACAGNNYGVFSYYPISGGQSTINFSEGWSSNFNSLDDVDYLTINGWSGSYNC